MIAKPIQKRKKRRKRPKQITKLVRVSAILLEKMGSCGELYYYARYFDSVQAVGKHKAGSSWSRVNINEAARMLHKKASTIRQALYLARRRGFFHSVTIKDGIATIRYASEARIAANFGMTTLGKFANVPLYRLRRSKFIAAEIEIEFQQERTKKAALKACEKQGVKGHIVPERILLKPLKTKKDCINWGGQTNCYHRGSRYTFADEDFLRYGATQERIGKRLHRSERTLRRRVSVSHRRDRNIKKLPKTQIAQHVPMNIKIDWRAAINFLSGEGAIFSETGRFLHFVPERGRPEVYLAHPNVYLISDVELIQHQVTKWKTTRLHRLLISKQSPGGNAQDKGTA